ncbi:MAG: hypothetical protein AB7O29_11720, partial [Acidimicrobiia bacterium]
DWTWQGGSHRAPGWPNANDRCWTEHYWDLAGLVPGTAYEVVVQLVDGAGRRGVATIRFTTPGS